MNFAPVDAIVKAVLYEGYILYPYRASNVKNRQRWTFGGVYPRDYARTGGQWRLLRSNRMPGSGQLRDGS